MQVRRYAICSVLITCFVIGAPLVSEYGAQLLAAEQSRELSDESEGICFWREDGVPIAFACDKTDTRTSDPLTRRLLGLPICWWSASAGDLQRISGVGARTAAGLARYRDVGGQPTIEQLDTIHRIGESIATKIAVAVTTDCRMKGL